MSITFDAAASAEIWSLFAETATIWRGGVVHTTLQLRFMKPATANPTPTPAGYSTRQKTTIETPIGGGLQVSDAIQRAGDPDDPGPTWRITAPSIDEGVHTYERYEVESIL